MGAQARQNRRGNEILQLHGKITHQEKLRDARGTNKPTKTKSTHKQTKPTDRQQTGSNRGKISVGPEYSFQFYVCIVLTRS